MRDPTFITQPILEKVYKEHTRFYPSTLRGLDQIPCFGVSLNNVHGRWVYQPTLLLARARHTLMLVSRSPVLGLKMDTGAGGYVRAYTKRSEDLFSIHRTNDSGKLQEYLSGISEEDSKTVWGWCDQEFGRIVKAMDLENTLLLWYHSIR